MSEPTIRPGSGGAAGGEGAWLDVRVEVARIDREQAETQKFAAEQRKLTEEASKLGAEQAKLYAEAFKLDRDWKLAPWVLVVSAMTAGAALFAAGAAFMRLLG